MEKRDYAGEIWRAKATVFTTAELALLWGVSGAAAVHAHAHHLVKVGRLIHLRRGLYAKSHDYNPWELASKVFVPSYVSFETILAKEGVIFQLYDTVFVASYLTREIEVDGSKYSYRRLADRILTSREGLVWDRGCLVASRERAFLDVLYLRREYHFDNLGSLDWAKAESLLPIYGNAAMARRFAALKKAHAV
jgi:predicted transcriptional regulator of viral defense system